MPGADDLDVSVIVPVRNGAKSLPPLLQSLRDQTLADERYEVIVVDNDSSDGTAEVAASHGARVVPEPIANRSRARNRGSEAARTRLYAFTDADCVAHPGWLEALLRCAHEAPLMAGKVELKVSDEPNAIERFEQRWRFAQESWVKQQGWAATANLLVDAQAFDAIGGFDPAWVHAVEDADFCIRAQQAGYGLGYCGDAVIEHEGERELRPMLRRFFMHGYGANQAFYRLGAIGGRAWRQPSKALFGDGALRDIGHRPDAFGPGESRRMARL